MSIRLIGRAAAATALLVSTACWTATASAADFENPYYGQPGPPVVTGPYPVVTGPYRAPYYAPRPPAPIVGYENCRVVHEKQIDRYGRSYVRRLRVCDEGIVEGRPGWGGGPRYGYDQPRYEPPRYEQQPRYDQRRYEQPRYGQQRGPGQPSYEDFDEEEIVR